MHYHLAERSWYCVLSFSIEVYQYHLVERYSKHVGLVS